MSNRRRIKYDPIRKHFWIPFGLSLLIIIVGVYMTLTDTKDLGYWKGRSGGRNDFILTGPATIVLGTVMCIVIFYFKRHLRKN